MSRIKKFVATILAMAMILAMTVMPVSASAAYPYLTTANGTQYTTEVPSTGVTLYVQKLSSSYIPTAFASDTEANAVSWTWNTTGSDSFYTSKGYIEQSGSYYAKYTVVPKNTATSGAYSIRASYDGAYIDLTIVIPEDSTDPKSATVNISVYSPGSSGFTATKTGATASSSNYYYATPLKALDAIIGTSYSNGETINSYIQSGGYVSSITGYDSNSNLIPKAADYSTGVGWNYRVYHGNGTMDGNSEIIDASAYKLSDGDYVRWYFGTYSDAVAYFNSFIPAN